LSNALKQGHHHIQVPVWLRPPVGPYSLATPKLELVVFFLIFYIFFVRWFYCFETFKNQEPRVNYQNQIPAQDWYYGPEIAPNLSTVLKKVK